MIRAPLPVPATHRKDSPLPSGTVTFLFTDIEGSTKLWEAHPETMQVALARHDALLRDTIVNANGYVFKTVGDAFCAAFAMASDAVSAALTAQRALHTEPWPEDAPIKVRMALHTGAVESRDRDYFGPPINRVARLLSTGYGGQTLVSQATYELSRDALAEAASLRDLGAHRLKDLARPEQVYELQHPVLRADFPPIRSLSTHPNNLTQHTTTFIGREKEILEIEALLSRNRLLTLTGSGGCGKTRLGLQIAAESLAQFPDGAWFVELAGLSDPALVAQTVATVLGVTEQPGEPIVRALTAHLKDKRLLLLLDNCEHLLDACAKLADTLVRHCPDVRIVATSREPLGIAGEKTYRVPSLSLPVRQQVQTPQSLSMYEAVQLFIDRALLVCADFQVTNQNAPAVASVCCHLDGIPLAIELAAARVRSLTVEEIDAKLDERFRLLTGGSRTALSRHQTLRSLIDWSYDLLSQSERRLVQRLSVFAGGWTLEAAEKICADQGVAADDVLDLLTSLDDKSLVVANQNEGRTRYRFLETVRQYGIDRLAECAGGDAVRQRHRNYFLMLAEEAEPNLTGAQQTAWLQRLAEEHENLRVALAWSLVEEESGGALRLCGALQRFWWMRGHFLEGREWCARVLGKEGAEGRTAERAKVLNAAGALAYFQSDYPAAKTRHEDSLAIARELGDRAGIARSLNNLGNVAIDQGDLANAQARHHEALAIRRDLGDEAGVASSLCNLGLAILYQGDTASARAPFEDSLAIRRGLGDRWGIALSLDHLANVALAQGDLGLARAQFEESLAIMRELENTTAIANTLTNLGGVALAQGDFASARSLFEGSLAIGREVGARWEIVYALNGLASLAGALGNPLRAARVWGAGERLRREIGSPLPSNHRHGFDRSLAAARAALGDDAAFDRAWHDGHSLTLEQAIEFAMEAKSQHAPI